MSGVFGSGTTTFGAFSMKFTSEDGVQIDGKKVPAINCTADDDTGMKYGIGNIPDYGQVKATVIILATEFDEMDSLVGTSAALVWTSDLEVSTNGTPASLTGTGLFLECPIVTEDNGLMKGAAVFQWAAAPTYVAETA
jgi:hypothetical protein